MMDKEQAEVEGRMIDASGSSDATITVFLVSHNWVHFVKILDNDMNRHQQQVQLLLSIIHQYIVYLTDLGGSSPI